LSWLLFLGGAVLAGASVVVLGIEDLGTRGRIVGVWLAVGAVALFAGAMLDVGHLGVA
jgi:hypothetical protein